MHLTKGKTVVESVACRVVEHYKQLGYKHFSVRLLNENIALVDIKIPPDRIILGISIADDHKYDINFIINPALLSYS